MSIANIEGNISRTFESVLHLHAGVTNYSTRQIMPRLVFQLFYKRLEIRSQKLEVRNTETASTKVNEIYFLEIMDHNYIVLYLLVIRMIYYYE